MTASNDAQIGPDEQAAPDLIQRLQTALPLVISAIAAVTAVGTIASRVLGGSKLQYLDYWRIIDTTVSDEGRFQVSNLLVLQNEHPVAAARVLYFANLRIFSGSNITLGVVVMALVAVQIVLLQRHNPMAGRLPRIVFLAATVALLFSTSGIHNFQYAMSGAAWLSANLAVVVAFHLMLRGHTVAACVSGLVASASYGTGLLVWPSLALLVLLNPDSAKKRLVPVTIGWMTSWVVYAAIFERPPGRSFPANPMGVLYRATSTLGAATSSELTPAILVGVLLIVGVLLAASRSTSFSHAPMSLALTLFGVLSSGLIAFSRSAFGDSGGLASRYVSISALTIIGILGLVSITAPRITLAGAVAFALLASFAGVPRITSIDNFDGQQRLNLEATIATTLATGEGYMPLFDARIRPKLVEVGHYPFDGSFDLDCGQLGNAVDAQPLIADRPQLDLFETSSPDQALRRFEGWLRRGDPIPQCLLVVSGGDAVGVGVVGGTPDQPGAKGRIKFVALVPVNAAGKLGIAGVMDSGAAVDYGWRSG